VIKKTLKIVLLSLLILISLFYIAMLQQLDKTIPVEDTALLTVESGSSINSWSKVLVKKGWIENRLWLRSYVRLKPQLAKLKAGTYQVSPETTLSELLNKVVDGQEYQFTITFVEGTTFKQWLSLLSSTEQIKQTLSNKSIAQIAQLLKIDQKNPEGWFYPDTYAFPANTTDIAVLKRAHQRMNKELNALWQQKANNLPYKGPYQALIMASIIEKESSKTTEQPLIASVFMNRLAKRMRLQTDPTVIYGLGDRYKGDIKRIHLREKTAYNTYRINGLPPTPIAMPGEKALHAALNPAISDYFYFVSQGNGQHQFSKTLAEHNKAVSRFILGKKKLN
jgi:UPF0755 protein